MPMSVNDHVLISYSSTYAGQRYLLTLPYKVTQTTSTQDIDEELEGLADYFSDVGIGAFLPTYLAVLPTNLSVDACRVQRIAPIRSVYVQKSLTLTGSFGESATTGNLQSPITLHSVKAGRAQIAVKKIGPIPPSAFDGGAQKASYRTLLNNLGLALINVAVVTDPPMTLEPVIYHKAILQSDLVIGYRIPTRVGTMRRRTLRVGE